MAGTVASVNTWRTMISTSATRRGRSCSSTGRDDPSAPSRGTKRRRMGPVPRPRGARPAPACRPARGDGGRCARPDAGRRPLTRAPITAASTSGAPSASQRAALTDLRATRSGTSRRRQSSASRVPDDSSGPRRTWSASTSVPVSRPNWIAVSSTARARRRWCRGRPRRCSSSPPSVAWHHAKRGAGWLASVGG